MSLRYRQANTGLALAVAALATAGCRKSPPPVPDSPAVLAQRAPAPKGEVAEIIYSGGLKNGWQDWGWTQKELAPDASAKVRFDQYGGWILAKMGLKGDFGGVVFRVKEPPGEGEFLEVHLMSTAGTALEKVQVGSSDRTDAGDGWTEVFVPMDRLDPKGVPFDRVVLQASRSFGSAPVAIDKIALTKVLLPPAATTRASMSIDCRAKATRISPRIFGVAPGGKDKASAAQLGATTGRWGGNLTTTYNWQVGAWNSGNDWFFENNSAPPYTKILEDDAAQHLKIALTVPIIGWVAKDKTSVSFPVSALGAQEKTDPWRGNAGNGKDRGGKPIATDPNHAYVPSTPASVKAWIEAIRKEDAKRGERTVDTYILDNEPMIWSTTHRDIHPDPTSYDELMERTIAYATAVREADPEAVIAGPAEWGWTGYMYSAKDIASGGPAARPDRRAHGDMPVIAYYLKTLQEYEKRTGVRLLDVLDLHIYPQGDSVYSDAAEAGVAALRIRSTRALWDPSYVDESWIKEPVRLLPRMREWVDQNYPGRGLSIGEWNFGGEKHMSGGLAMAEALGRFAQFGLTSAYYWMDPPAESPGMWAFRAYRNYDGQGSRFLDWFTAASSDHPGQQSIFASRDDTGKHLVAVVLNFSPRDPAAAEIDVSTCGRVESMHTYTYDGGPAGFTPGAASGAARGVTQTLPPYSITVLDMQLAESAPVAR